MIDMFKSAIAILSCVLLVTGCSSFQEASINEMSKRQFSDPVKGEIPAYFFPKELKAVAIGDSLTEGVGDITKKGGYVPFLKKSMESDKAIKRVEMANLGIKGQRSGQLLKRLQTEELVTEKIKQADQVFITIGGNDIMKIVRENLFNLTMDVFDKGQKGYGERLDSIIGGIREINPEAQITLIGLYNPFMNMFNNMEELDEIVEAWNEESKQILNRYENTSFVEIADLFEESEGLLYKDEFHPNEKGYKLIADRVYKTIAKGG